MPVEGRTVVLGFVAEVEPVVVVGFTVDGCLVVEGVLDTEVPGFVVTDGLFDELDEPDVTRPTAPDVERFIEPEV